MGVRRATGLLVLVWAGIGCACERRPAAASPPTAGGGASALSSAGGAHPPKAAAPVCAHDDEAERLVAAELIRRVEEARSQPRVRARVTFPCVPAVAVDAPVHVDGLRAHGHGGNATLISLDMAAEGGDVRAVRLTSDRNPKLDGPPPAITVARAHVEPERARKALFLVRAALAARVEVALPPPVAGETQSVSVKATTHDEHIEIVLRGPEAERTSDTWEGYVNSLAEEKRAPLDIAWTAIADLLPVTFADVAAVPPDRQLFSRMWQSEAPRADWVRDALLGLAAALGDGEVVAAATAALDSKHVRTRILAVNALAAVTGRDLRRTAAGGARPLSEVVADYRRLRAAPR